MIAILLSVFDLGEREANIIKAIEKLQSAHQMLVQQLRKSRSSEVISFT